MCWDEYPTNMMYWQEYPTTMTCWREYHQNGEDWSDSAVIAEAEVDRSEAKWVDYDLTFILKSAFATFKCVHYETPF